MGRRPKKRGRDVHGVVLLDKPQGLSSNQALQRVKRLFNANKAGHTGTLDPMATGLLPLCLGEATKVAAYLTDADKAYEATLRLGIKTNTADVEGTVIETLPIPEGWHANIAEICAALIGELDQVPPMYSAIKVDGKPLYKLAREGKEIERKARAVSIREIKVIHKDEVSLTFYVRCSKGTYVRTLGESIAERLGTCGHLTMLRRSEVIPYSSETMFTLEQLEALAEDGLDVLDEQLQPVDTAIKYWAELQLNKETAERIQMGQRVRLDEGLGQKEGLLRMYDNQLFIGIGEYKEGVLHPIRLMRY